MVTDGKKIAIVGGGPGGLLLARLLQLKGADVTVYERDPGPESRVQGATLDLHEESGLEALRRAGLIEGFYARYRPDAGRLRVTDAQGTIRMDDHGDGHYTEDRPEIDRAPLRALLLESLQPGTVAWDSRFRSMDRQDRGWTLRFENGRSANTDIVVAADGAHSKVRPFLTRVAPVYSGITIVEGNVYDAERNAPKLWKLVRGGKLFALGGGQSLILSAKGEGSLSFYTGCPVPEDWAQASGIDFSDRRQVRDWFQSAFRGWSGQWSELFAGDEAWFMPRPQYHYPPDQHWESRPDLTMIGDAAHRMPPYAGEGVNMAMQDALELSECLTDERFTDARQAIAEYEAGMLRRAAAVTRDTLESTELLHSENGLERLLELFRGHGA